MSVKEQAREVRNEKSKTKKEQQAFGLAVKRPVRTFVSHRFKFVELNPSCKLVPPASSSGPMWMAWAAELLVPRWKTWIELPTLAFLVPALTGIPGIKQPPKFCLSN